VVRRLVVALLAVACALGTVVSAAADDDGGVDRDDQPLTIKVVGSGLVNGVGRPLRLAGVTRSGTETMCARGAGVFDGPADEASVRAIASWPVNVVRVPLNQDCWLGDGEVPAQYSGGAYRAAIVEYVRTLHRNGLYAELSLASPASMPDDRASGFWQSVATTFGHDAATMFNLYGAPHDVSWRCWRDGGRACPGVRATGMQTLVNAVRSTGAEQPIAVSGIGWGNDVSEWLRWRPTDPGAALVAEVHVFDGSACRDVACWRRTVLPVAAKVPVVTGELGVTRCGRSVVDSYLPFARGGGISYVAWTWNVGAGCSALIASWAGVPTAYGFLFKQQLTAPTPTPPVAAAAPAPAPAPAAERAGLVVAGALALAVVLLGLLTALVLRRGRRRRRA
jgi:endoglucanase